MWWSFWGQTIYLQSCVELAHLHDEIIVLSRLFVGSCATVGLTEVQCQLGRPVTLTECSFSESRAFPNAVKTDWNPYVYPRSHCYMISSCFVELWTCSAEDAIFPCALCSVCKGMLERGIRLVKWLNSQTKRSRQRDRRSSKPQSRFYFMNKR